MLSIKYIVAAGLLLVMGAAGAQTTAAAQVSFVVKCTFDGNPAVIESVTIEGNYPTAESRTAAAQAACKPVIERANLECSLDEDAIEAELLSLVDDDTQRARRAHLREQLEAARAPRPAYCQ